MNRVDNDEIHVYILKSFFAKEAVLKCLYWYGDKFHTEIGDEGLHYHIRLQLKSDLSPNEFDLRLYLQKLERDVIDYNLRHIVTKETRNVRDLLIAKAFANGEFDELPGGIISDPVGFNADMTL